MIYVGIDVASEKHDFFMISDLTGEAYQTSSVTIANNLQGFQELENAIHLFSKDTNDPNIRIGLESTGIYHQNILAHLITSGYEVSLLNPVLTNMFCKSSKVHHPKNDNLDSQNICKFLIDHKAEFKPYSPSLYNLTELKSLERARFYVAEDKRKAELRLYTIIKKSFPEFLHFFSKLSGDSSIRILRKYPTPDKVASAHDKTLASLIHGACKCDIQKLKLAAKNSIGIYFGSTAFQIQDAIDELEHVKNREKAYDHEIERLVKEISPNLLSVPGIGVTSAGIILGEIGDISRFHSAEALVSFAGVDIETYQSGKYIAHDCYISKKGSKYLRYALFQVSRVIWQYDEIYHQYYDKKKSEGKHHYVAIGHIEKKVTRLIYSILKNNTTYVKTKIVAA